MLPARKTVSKKTLHDEHSSNTFGLRSQPVVYLMNQVYIAKKISMEALKYCEK